VAFIKLQFKPGVNRDTTDYSGEGGWWECDKIRFRSGFPEKLGGWQHALSASFIGYCRQMWNWVTTFQDNLTAIGTNVKVYIEVAGNLFDITPLRTVDPTFIAPTTTNSVSTTIGTTTVVFNFGAVVHEAETGSYVQISGVVGPIGGILSAEINGNHQITKIDNFKFSIQSLTTATATVAAAGGAGITVSFEIAPGYAITTAGYGWGTGTWGRGAWGSGTTTPIYLPLRDWWFDNFDNDLVMNIRNGEGYWWERGILSVPDVALATKAIRLVDYAAAQGFDPTAVPIKIMQLLVSQQDKHLIAFGAVPFGFTDPADFDPLLIRWSDQDTPGQWFPEVTNTAGDIRLSRGSRIVRALPTRQEILVWTDTTLYTLQFLGTTDVYGLQEYSDNISIISPRACISASNVTFWMGKDKFYAYTGRVETLPCTLRKHVFQNINRYQADQIICGTNEEWNEVWWFYPSANSDYNDSYVVYNHLDQVWYYGMLPRTAWLDTALHPDPLACNTPTDTNAGMLYQHEIGLDDDGEPMVSYIRSNDFDLEDGEHYMLLKRLIPDVDFSHSLVNADVIPDPHTHGNPVVTITMYSRNFPGSARFSDPADTQAVVFDSDVGLYTEQVFMRARARQMAFQIKSENLGVQWALGSPRIEARADGKR